MNDRERNLGRLSDKMDDLAESFINGNYNHVIDRIQDDAEAQTRDDYVLALLAVGIYQRLVQHDELNPKGVRPIAEMFQFALERRII